MCTAQRGFAEELPTGAHAGEKPTSEDAEIVIWGEGPNGDQSRSKKTLYCSKTLCLNGDWRDTILLAGTAWGDGHGGNDVWTSEPKSINGKAHKLEFTGILPHAQWQGQYYFTVKLEIANSRSDKIAAMFRYRHHRGADGVIAAAFKFCDHLGVAVGRT